MRTQKNIIYIFSIALIAIVFFGFFPYSSIAISEKTSPVPGIKLYTFPKDTSCSSHPKEQAEHVLIVPESGDIQRVYVYFHGLQPVNTTVAKLCHGYHDLCDTAKSLKGSGVTAAIIAPRMEKTGTNVFAEYSKTELECFLTQAQNELNGLGRTLGTEFYLAGHSAGGRSIQEALADGIKINGKSPSKTLVFDGCYGDWCKGIVNKGNVGELYMYGAADEPGVTYPNMEPLKTQSKVKRLLKLTPESTGLSVGSVHRNVPRLCFTDHQVGGNCGGTATPIVDGNPSNIAGDGSPLTITNDISLFSEVETVIHKPQPRIRIPGLSFSNPKDLTESNSAEGRFLYIPFLGEYIGAIYKWLVAAISILAVIMIIVAGVQRMMAGGASDKISASNKRIIQAITGLIVAVTSYTLLLAINPSLVEFKSLKIQIVTGVALSEVVPPDFKTGKLTSDEGDASKASSADPVATKSDNCKTSQSVPSGIGNTSLLGQLDCHSFRSRELADIPYIILHEGGSTAARTVKAWKNGYNGGGAPISSHYYVERDGSIYQILDEKKVAHHTPGGNWNQASIGIDLQINVPGDRSTTQCFIGAKTGKYKTYSGKEKTTKKVANAAEAIEKCGISYTDAQYSSLNTLINSISDRTGVAKTGEFVRAHCNTAANHADPRNLHWSRLGMSEYPEKGMCKFFPDKQQEIDKLVSKYFAN